MDLIKKISRYVKNLITIRRFRVLVFFVTSRCNSKCKTCFYWKNINKVTNELSLEEIKAISSKLGKIDTIQLSGGEPFLRNDLKKICELFYLNNQVKTINIPTNGLLSETIKDLTEKILNICTGSNITVCCALDGLEDMHDKIRGVEGNFERFKYTANLLKELERRYPNFTPVVLTTLCRYNYGQYKEIEEFVRKKLGMVHYFDITRQHTAEDGQTEAVPFGIIEEIGKEKCSAIYHYSKNNILRRMIQIGETKVFNKIFEGARMGKKWPLQCSAGVNAAVLEPNGDVKLCENGPVIANVRQHGYDIFNILNSPEASRIRKHIRDSHCSCDNSVFLNLSINNSRYYKLKGLIEGAANLLWSKQA